MTHRRADLPRRRSRPFAAQKPKQMLDPRSGQWTTGHSVPFLVAAIGSIIERHMIATDFLVVDAANASSSPPLETTAAKRAPTVLGPLSPKCREPGLVKDAGCLPCTHWRWQ